MKRHAYHVDGSKPINDKVIFVFGSNLAGIHGAGAAKEAFVSYGAKWGTGSGQTGMSYAIPTKDHQIQTMTSDKITPYVNEFIRFATQYPTVGFFVTRIGCGLAGYKDSDIAPLFKDAPINCSFAEDWRKYLETEL